MIQDRLEMNDSDSNPDYSDWNQDWDFFYSKRKMCGKIIKVNNGKLIEKKPNKQMI